MSRMMCSFLTWTMGGDGCVIQGKYEDLRKWFSLAGQVQVFGFGHAEYEGTLRH